MRVGNTRRCCRGQMLRARDRDQRRVAGASSDSLAARVCMEAPLAKRIARICSVLPWGERQVGVAAWAEEPMVEMTLGLIERGWAPKRRGKKWEAAQGGSG